MKMDSLFNELKNNSETINLLSIIIKVMLNIIESLSKIVKVLSINIILRSITMVLRGKMRFNDCMGNRPVAPTGNIIISNP